MESEKRKRENIGEGSGVRRKPREAVDGRKRAAPPPGDEEVDEFFAMLKRVQVAIKYFRGRDNVDGESTAKSPWNPAFQREDFDGVKTDPGGSREHEKRGFDLNSDPVSDAPDSV